MSEIIFIGVDLAWSDRNPTGVAILKTSKTGTRLSAVHTINGGVSIKIGSSLSKFGRKQSQMNR
jgi:predicted RNase H-like nuclease